MSRNKNNAGESDHQRKPSEVDREEKQMFKRKAVIVGINDYKGTINDLPSCVRDAEAFADCLNHKFGFSEIKLLTDSEATLPAVSSALDWLVKGAASGDRLVFYYSGHGTTQPSGNVMEEYLVLYDDLLKDDLLSQKTQDIPDGVLTVILDSCFSGGMEKRLYETVNKAAFATGLESLSNFGHTYIPERSKVKSFMCEPVKAKVIEDSMAKTTVYKPFGQSGKLTPGGYELALAKASISDETDQVQLKGVLISASTETETATASTSQTNGLSAFTFCVLRVLETRGLNLSFQQLIEESIVELRALGLRQTPLLKARPEALVLRTFLNLDSVPPTSQGTSPQSRQLIDSLISRIRQQIGSLSSIRTNAMNDKAVIDLLTAILPAIIDSVAREKTMVPPYSYTGQVIPTANDVLTTQAKLAWLPILTTIIPPLVEAITKEQNKSVYLQPQFNPPTEEKFAWLPLLGAVLPHIIDIATKEAAPGVYPQQPIYTQHMGLGNVPAGSCQQVEKGALLAALLPTVLPIALEAAQAVRAGLANRAAYGAERGGYPGYATTASAFNSASAPRYAVTGAQ
ncbi:MAG: caspase family protein [Candidatus Obscuribacter sp.]|nr:caspase family protein [Candidatus Obscuribacter sp.]